MQSPVRFEPSTGLMIKTNRSNLLAEHVTYFRPSDYSYRTATAAFVLDVTANVRKLQLAGLLTYGDLVISFWDMAANYGKE